MDDHGAADDDAAIVRSMMRVAGLEPSEDELQQLVAAYPGHRQAVDQLYAVAMPKEQRPQPVFGFDESRDGRG